MKLNDILEADDKVVPITQALKKRERVYTPSEEGPPKETMAYQFVQSMLKGQVKLQPFKTPPQIEPFKKLTPRALETMLKKRVPWLSQADSGFLTISNGKEDDGRPALQISTWRHELGAALKRGKIKAVSDKTIENSIYVEIAKILGSYVQQIKRVGMMAFPVFVLSDEFLKSSGVQMGKPSLGSTVKNILKKFDITGFGLDWVDKQKTGYRVKIEGMELVDNQTLKHVEQAFRQHFGDDFIKMTNDGEIDSIGHRPVAPNMTNYRVWLRHGILDRYRK